MKVNRPWTNKKEPTNPKKKEQHVDRKTKKAILHGLEEQDWKYQLQEYKEQNADSKV